MGEENSEKPEKDEAPPGKSIGEIMHVARHAVVSLFAHIDYGVKKVKTMMPRAALQEGTEKIFSPIQNLRLNIEQGVLSTSREMNKNYPFVSSMAKAHQGMLTAQIGLGSGILTTVAFKSMVKRRARLFIGVSAIMALDTYTFCELCKFQEHHKKVNVSRVS